MTQDEANNTSRLNAIRANNKGARRRLKNLKSSSVDRVIAQKLYDSLVKLYVKVSAYGIGDQTKYTKKPMSKECSNAGEAINFAARNGYSAAKFVSLKKR